MRCKLQILHEKNKSYSIIIQCFKGKLGVTFFKNFTYTEYHPKRIKKAINFDYLRHKKKC